MATAPAMDPNLGDLSPATWAHLGKGLARCYMVLYNVEQQTFLLHPLEPTFSCPISTEVAQDPVMTVDGHVYDKKNIQQWFRTRNPPTSPSTGLRLSSRALFPLQLFKAFVQSYMNNRHEIRDSYVGVRAMEELNCTLRSELKTLKKELTIRDMEMRRLEMRLAELRDDRDSHARLVQVYSAIARDSQQVLKIQKCVRRFLRRRNVEDVYKAQRKMDEKETKHERKSRTRRLQTIKARDKRRARSVREKLEGLQPPWVDKRMISAMWKKASHLRNLETTLRKSDADVESTLRRCEVILDDFDPEDSSSEYSSSSEDCATTPGSGCGQVCTVRFRSRSIRNHESFFTLRLYDSPDSLKASNYLCVTDLPENAEEQELWDIFAEFGDLRDVRVGVEVTSKLPCAFVTFICEDDAEDAKINMHRQCIGNHSLIKVYFAELSGVY